MTAEAMLPSSNHDEQAFQYFVRDLRRHLRDKVMPGAAEVFATKVEPQFEKDHGRPIESYHDVRRAMTKNSFYQFWSAMQRCSQEMMWESVITPTERGLDELVQRFLDTAEKNPAGGSLELDPNLQIPRYHTAVDIHIQPGGYHTEFTAHDLAAGAIYLAGFPIYIDGELGPLSDRIGSSLLNYLRKNHADIQPATILDMGCAVGNSTLPWVSEFPSADVHAIDVAAPCLRFAHARAELMQAKVAFSQQNAERTRYEDNTFDVVVSHIMLHETSKPALANIIAETYRILRPGGLMLHLDVPRGDSHFGRFMSQWETYNNNEVFSAYMTEVNLPRVAQDAGFDADKVVMAGAVHGDDGVQHAYSEGGFEWPVLVGTK